ncbi:MAG TPA: MFS transporter [Streptosporangiaceae bacterium]|nr:MFS transporter [Streptosporangiaceae bacterium]
MATTVGGTVSAPGLAARGLWQRQLNHYPDTGRRVLYLGVVVLATIMLYYELYIPGAVSPTIIASYHMTFSYYVYIVVIGNAVGAFGSLLAGLADRWGRANLVAYGLVVTALLTLFGVPNAPNKVTFGVIYGAIAVVEGVILVATPALIRDFSPQLGRASAMGFWTLGPVVGSLVVAIVSSNTLSHLHAWQDQFIICGIVGLVIAVVAVVALRELSPRLRDQLMVSVRDRALIEARAQGIDLSASLRHPWRQMLHLDVIGSAFAISVFLIVYYTAVGFFTVYFSSLFGYSLSKANGLGNWFWAFDAGALIVIGIISDRVKVRKPFMVLGAVGAIIMTIIFGSFAGHAHTSYSTFVLVISLLAVFLAIAYAPWMASFTETVEKHNPALTATGLAVWGWIIRAVIALSTLCLPFVVSSMTPLVTYGSQVQTLSVKYAPQLATAAVIDPATQAALKANPANQAAAAKAVGEIAKAQKVPVPVAIARLKALATIPPADQAFLAAHGTQVENASKAAAGQWKNWWWVAVGGEVVFIPLIFLMTGRWDPRRARQDAAAHEQRVQEELASLRTE